MAKGTPGDDVGGIKLDNKAKLKPPVTSLRMIIVVKVRHLPDNSTIIRGNISTSTVIAVNFGKLYLTTFCQCQ